MRPITVEQATQKFYSFLWVSAFIGSPMESRYRMEGELERKRDALFEFVNWLSEEVQAFAKHVVGKRERRLP